MLSTLILSLNKRNTFSFRSTKSISGRMVDIVSFTDTKVSAIWVIRQYLTLIYMCSNYIVFRSHKNFVEKRNFNPKRNTIKIKL